MEIRKTKSKTALLVPFSSQQYETLEKLHQKQAKSIRVIVSSYDDEEIYLDPVDLQWSDDGEFDVLYSYAAALAAKLTAKYVHLYDYRLEVIFYLAEKPFALEYELDARISKVTKKKKITIKPPKND